MELARELLFAGFKLRLAHVLIALSVACLVSFPAVAGNSPLAPAAQAIDAGDFGSTAITRAQLDQFLPPPSVNPFNQTNHVVLQLQGESKPLKLPAAMQWISQPWNGENAQMPYLVYLPQKDRLLMLVQSGQPIHSAIITSDDHGRTWSQRHWLGTDAAGHPTGVGLGLTHLGEGRLLAFPEDLKTRWNSMDYGNTWTQSPAPPAASELYSWDPILVMPSPGSQLPRLVQGVWAPTGVPWGSAEAPYSQAYLRTTTDDASAWTAATKVPQWLGVNEVSLIIAGNGDWIAACRTDYPKRFAHLQFDHYGGLAVSTSKDQGKSWSTPKPLCEWGRHHPSLVLLSDKRLLMTYVVRLGYPNNPQGYPQFGVEAVTSSDNGQSWDFNRRYVLAVWSGSLKDERSWFCSVQSTSTILLRDGTLLTAFGTGFSNPPTATKCKMDIALVSWRLQ
jgi:hypothetical protein